MIEESMCAYCLHLAIIGFTMNDEKVACLRCPVFGTEVHEVSVDFCNYYEELLAVDWPNRLEVLGECYP